MALSYKIETVCLDVAIDHRIRRLLKPVDVPSKTANSTHLFSLEDRGRQLGRSEDEIRVTSELAGPPMTGGILVALQQPRNDHPFDKGIEEVINDCETLAALDELFDVVSCGTLLIGRDVSVVDLLPYITEEEMKRMDDVRLRDAFLSTVHIFGRKKPQILLCCGKISLTKERKDDRKGEAWKFESERLGTSFGKWTTIRFRDETHNWVSTQRVNGFHPSYSVNYHPHISCIRQLQILAVAEACGMYRGDWKEETWMKSLRDSCASLAKRLKENSGQRPPMSRWPQGNSQLQRTRRNYLPDYGEMYHDILDEIKEAIGLLSDSTSLYDGLLQSCLSTRCNDTNLILRQMSASINKGWPERFDKWNKRVLRTAVENTRRFLVDVPGCAGHLRLRPVLARFVSSLGQHVANIGEGELPLAIHLENMRECFLSTAQDLETALGELLESDEANSSSGTDVNSLSGLMEALEI